MTFRLFLEAVLKFVCGIILVGLLIFLPAWTINYLNGWLLMGVLFIPMLIVGIIMMIKNPMLLASRLSVKEKQKEQGLVIKLSGVMFILGFILAGLDYRYKWIFLPQVVSYIAVIVFVLSYIMLGVVLVQNTYLARTIKVVENQKVIDTGLYSVVRHPMYSATLLLFLSMPLVLGSVYSFIIFLAYPLIIAKRIKGEEKFLEKELIGYKEYKQKVKYRLIPFIW